MNLLNDNRNHWRSADWWAQWIKEAKQLPETDLRRHASVSRNNNHRCVECYCCACLTVLEENYKTTKRI